MTTKDRPRIHPDSPLQNWEQICMLAAMGRPLQYRSNTSDSDCWAGVPPWGSNDDWWHIWSQWPTTQWYFRHARWAKDYIDV